MSGILDSKSRVMDTVVTQQGRKQLANGGLSISYASFTDSTAYYLADAVSGSQDASERICLEAAELPQDMITFEADEFGKLLPFTPSAGSSTSEYSNIAGQVFVNSVSGGYIPIDCSPVDASLGVSVPSNFQNLFTTGIADELLASSLQNFKNLYIIGSINEGLDDLSVDRFGLSQTSITFNVDGERPVDDQTKHSVNINERDSIFNDQRFSRIHNFKFLPPLRVKPPTQQHVEAVIQQQTPIVNKLPSKLSRFRSDISHDSGQGFAVKTTSKTEIQNDMSLYLLGRYAPLGSIHSLTDNELLAGLKSFESMGYRVDVDFTPRPQDNRVICQVFERKGGTLSKLDIVEFGRVKLENGQLGDVYFLGKVIIDDNNTNTFVHIFTMIFESYDPSSKQSRSQAKIKSSMRGI